jgi:arylsulfatase A-like enzyme
MANRRDFLKVGVGAAAAALAQPLETALGMPATHKGPGSKPNIVLILADDMGFSDIGCFGSEISTPNLDRLASRGIRISQFYNNPRCCPSRASIMTGLYSQQAGMGMMVADHGRYPYPGYAGELSKQTLTIPEALKTAGYNTAMVGKWHLGTEDSEGKHDWPLQRGFDHFWGMIAGASVYYESPHLFSGNDPLPPPPADQYLTDLWAEHAAGYVTELAAQKQPFFLYTAFNAPHWPIQAPEDLIGKYSKRYADGWDALRKERHKKQLAMGIVSDKWELTPRDPRVPAWENVDSKDWEMRRMAVYAAMIDRLDTGIGRIIDSLEKAGVADNTLIVFMSDNGGNAEEIGRGKRTEQPTGTQEGLLHVSGTTESHACEQGMTCAGNVPGVMPGSENTFQSIGIPWGNCANTPFRLYKHYTQEGGISTPFIACWPAGIKPQSTPVPSVGHETDLMPTFLELAGATYPASVAAGPIPALAGQSLTPVFAGKSRTRVPIYWEHEGNKALRDGKWKIVSRFPEKWELYDMEADRTELHDLAASQPERTKAMAEMWDAWAKRCGVQQWPMPETPPNERSGTLGVPPYLQKYKAATQ